MGGIYEMKKPRRINSFSVTIFLLVSTISYLGYWYIPLWWPVFQLTGIMRGTCNDAYHQYDNEALMTKLLKDSTRTGLRLTREHFKLQRVPYTEAELVKLNLDSYSSNVYRKRGKKCVLAFHYKTVSQLPVIEKPVKLEFDREVETDLAVIKW